MRFFGSLIGFIIALIIGAAGLWIAAHYVHIPGIKATQNTSLNSGGNGQNNNNGGNNQRNVTSANTMTLVGGFPGNVPVYQPSVLALSTKTTHGDKTVVYSASYTSSDQLTTISQFYKNQLSSNGWHIDNQNQSGGITTFKASGHNEQLNVLIAQISGPTTGAATVNSGFQLAVTPNF